jgi:hypothetical protein
MNYSQLPPPLKDKVNQVEKFIKSQIQIQEELQGHKLDRSINLKVLENKIATAALSVEKDFHNICKLNARVNKELRHSDLISRYLSMGGKTNQEGFFNYFRALTKELEGRIVDLKNKLEELEMCVKSSKNFGTPLAIQDTIYRQNEVLISMANLVSNIHDQISGQKREFLEFCKKYNIRSDHRLKLSSSSDSGDTREKLSDIAANLVPS